MLKRAKWVPRSEIARNKMQRLRLARGWSRAELGRRAMVNATDVGRIESGRMVPFSGQLARISEALDVPLAEAETLLQEVKVIDRIQDPEE